MVLITEVVYFFSVHRLHKITNFAQLYLCLLSKFLLSLFIKFLFFSFVQRLRFIELFYNRSFVSSTLHSLFLFLFYCFFKVFSSLLSLFFKFQLFLFFLQVFLLFDLPYVVFHFLLFALLKCMSFCLVELHFLNEPFGLLLFSDVVLLGLLLYHRINVKSLRVQTLKLAL